METAVKHDTHVWVRLTDKGRRHLKKYLSPYDPKKANLEYRMRLIGDGWIRLKFEEFLDAFGGKQVPGLRAKDRRQTRVEMFDGELRFADPTE